MIELGLSCVAVALAALALIRSYVPPQSRRVAELSLAVADLHEAMEEYGRRLTNWKRTEGMEEARAAFTKRRKASDDVLSQAQAVLAASTSAPPPPAAPTTKEELRRAVGIVR